MYQRPDLHLNLHTEPAAGGGVQSNLPRTLFTFCLAGSLLIHVATAFMLLQPHTSPGLATRIPFIEMKDVSLPTPVETPQSLPPDVPVVQNLPQQPPPEMQPETGRDTDKAQAVDASAETVSPSLGPGMAKGYFRSLGEGKTLRDDIRNYYFEMVERINARWWQRAGSLNDTARQEGIINIVLGRDGTLQDVRLAAGTGSGEVDQAIIEAISDASPFAALPASYQGEQFRAPLRIVAPSTLLRFNR